jgi:hypothetical protein
MSWSIYKQGTPEEVIIALKEQSNTLSDQSKEEYDQALPHLIGLVSENIGGEINLSAYGHGVKNADGVYCDKNCQVDIKRRF